MAPIERLEQKLRELLKRYKDVSDERNALAARLKEREDELLDLRELKRGVHERAGRMLEEVERISSRRPQVKA